MHFISHKANKFIYDNNFCFHFFVEAVALLSFLGQAGVFIPDIQTNALLLAQNEFFPELGETLSLSYQSFLTNSEGDILSTLLFVCFGNTLLFGFELFWKCYYSFVFVLEVRCSYWYSFWKNRLTFCPNLNVS